MQYCVASNPKTVTTVPVPLSGDFCDNLQKAKTMGYDAIEIHVPDVNQLDTDAICNAMESGGMRVATLGTGTIYGKYGLHLCDADTKQQQRLFAMVQEFIDCAAKLHARVTIGSIKGNIRPDEDYDQHMDILGHALKRIDTYAGEKGVVILLEATNRYENNVLNNAKQIAGLIRQYQLYNTQILLDAFHMNIEEQSLLDSLDDAGDLLGHIHFADNNRRYPGAGCFPFAAFADKIRAIGYEGMLSVECLPWPNGDEAAREAAKFLHNTFDDKCDNL